MECPCYLYLGKPACFRTTALTFDTMWTRSEYVYHEYIDQVIGFVDVGVPLDGKPRQSANLLMVFLLRGVFTNWKQVVGYALLRHGGEMPYSLHFLMDALCRADDIDTIIVVVVCNLDILQQKMAKDIGVTDKQ